MTNGLIYIGKGFLPGIPARDLSAEDVKKYGGKSALLDTGLYAEPEKKVKPTKTQRKVIEIVEA